MKIGELAAATGTSVESIRFYEREGLLAPPSRTAGNYRIYGEGHEERLAFIRRCRSLDMALEEVRALLQFKDSPAENCGNVNDLLDAHIGHVASRIAELRSLQLQLEDLRAQCSSAQTAGECGILQELAQPASPEPARGRAHVSGVHGQPRRAAR
ncbi:MAG: Cd(II)/Pb(II)-responsive transcriptional regulator [Caldimonas sp.]